MCPCMSSNASDLAGSAAMYACFFLCMPSDATDLQIVQLCMYALSSACLQRMYVCMYGTFMHDCNDCWLCTTGAICLELYDRSSGAKICDSCPQLGSLPSRPLLLPFHAWEPQGSVGMLPFYHYCRHWISCLTYSMCCYMMLLLPTGNEPWLPSWCVTITYVLCIVTVLVVL